MNDVNVGFDGDAVEDREVGESRGIDGVGNHGGKGYRDDIRNGQCQEVCRMVNIEEARECQNDLEGDEIGGNSRDGVVPLQNCSKGLE